MIKVLKSGLLTSIQDLGRYGYQKHGVIASGVMDQESHRIANLLVGNETNAPTMEVTLMGPILEFQEDALISICGGDLSPIIDGDPVKVWKPVLIKKGSELRFGQPKRGFRAYLAVAGGFDIPKVMGSASTYIRAGMGGFEGRPLDKDDVLPINSLSTEPKKLLEEYKSKKSKKTFIESPWFVGPDLTGQGIEKQPVRVMRGREFELFDNESQEDFFQGAFKIDSKSDRMGYRLNGPNLAMKKKTDILSEAVTFGTVQVPPEGNPIILLADRQTTGGYPKIGQIASVDLPKVAQMRPGESIDFQEITHEEAQRLYLERERDLKQLARGIKMKFH